MYVLFSWLGSSSILVVFCLSKSNGGYGAPHETINNHNCNTCPKFPYTSWFRTSSLSIWGGPKRLRVSEEGEELDWRIQIRTMSYSSVSLHRTAEKAIKKFAFPGQQLMQWSTSEREARGEKRKGCRNVVAIETRWKIFKFLTRDRLESKSPLMHLRS